MIEKIKNLIKKIPYGLIPMVVVGILTVIGAIITFLIVYKAPISMNDVKDKTDIVNMIQNQHPGSEILNIELMDETILYPETFDSIYVKSTRITNEDDVFWYTRTVDYDVVNDKDTVNYRTIFEIKEKFLHNEVNQFLFKINKEDETITY